jgi:ribosomal protein L13E
MFTIPNDVRGRLILWVIRRYLNSDRYKVVKRGRGAVVPMRYAFGVPLNNAKRIGVYIDDRYLGRRVYDEAKGLAVGRVYGL